MWNKAKKLLNLDGWNNVLTGMNVAGKDKRTGAVPVSRFLTKQEIDPFYQIDDIAAKVVDRLPEDMMREGFCVYTDDGSDEYNEAVQEYFEKYDLYKKVEYCLKKQRLYGGAGIIIGARDGTDVSLPLSPNGYRSIDYFTALDRYRLYPFDSTSIDRDPTSMNFGKPLYYKIVNVNDQVGNSKMIQSMIHYSRIIRFEGIEVAYDYESQVDYWGDSVLSRLYDIIRDFQSAYSSAAAILPDFTQLVFKLQNLPDMIANGDDRLVQQRLALLSSTASIINAIVISEGEDMERKTTNVAGLSELLKAVDRRLVMATEMTHVVLLGDSPSGLGATGEVETRMWYDHVRNVQESKLRPVLKQLLKVIFMAKDGPTGGKLPKKLNVEFNPLWQMSDKEAADLRFVQAQTDEKYIGTGVVDADEIAESRFGSGKYSTETQLDMETRTAIANATPDEPDVEDPAIAPPATEE